MATAAQQVKANKADRSSLQSADGKVSRQHRKRITDRLAQRAHRDRQRQYVEDLEDELSRLKSNQSLSRSKIQEENEGLRQEIGNLKALLATISSMASTYTDSASAQASSQTANGETEPKPRSAAIDESGQPIQDVDIQPESALESCHDYSVLDHLLPSFPSEDHIHPRILFNSTAPHILGSEQKAPYGSDFDMTNTGDLDKDLIFQGENDTALLDSWHATTTDSQLHLLLHPTVPGDLPISLSSDTPLAHGSRGSNVSNAYSSVQDSTGIPASVARLSTAGGEWLADAWSWTGSSMRIPVYRAYPNVRVPPQPQDVEIHHMIESVRWSTVSQRLLLPPPRVVDFLFDNKSNDPLSTTLKKYLEPVRHSGRVEDHLAVYWALYLSIRWQANLDSESFDKLPAWYRPSMVQINLEHPILFDFFFWPSIRDELIKLSQTNQGKAYEIMHFAGKCCYLDAPSDVWTDLSDDKLNRIVCDLRNWKLSDRFFERFPWWRKLYVQSIAMFQTA